MFDNNYDLPFIPDNQDTNITTKQGNEMDIIINNVKYVKEQSEHEQYYIVRTYSAGVFAGYIESRNGREVVMTQARRLWKWSGAASLSQLAMEGVKNPSDCKFPCEVHRITLLEAIEILECTETARKSIFGVYVWSA